MSEEIHEKWTVEILTQLVQDKPISQFSFLDKLLDLDNLIGPLKVSVESHVEQLESDVSGAKLDGSVDESEEGNDCDEQEPPPEDEEYFVIDDVESENADGSYVFLFSTSSIPKVVARSNSRKSVAHRVLYSSDIVSLLLWW